MKVNVNEVQLRNLQEGHGGWNPRMVQVCVKSSMDSTKSS